MKSELYDLEVKAAKKLNGYVMTPNKEKTWMVLGSEFGDDIGKSAINIRVLHGLRSADSFRAHLAQCMWELWCESCKTDLDLWLKPKTRSEDMSGYFL